MKLAAFIPRLEALSSPEFLTELGRELADETVTLISREFNEEKGPYGRQWAPQKRPRNRILYKSGALFNAWSVYPNGKGVRITNSVPYAAAHQYGHTYAAKSNIKRKVTTKQWTLPARPMLPSASQKLGPMWRRAFDAAFSRSISRALRP